MFPRRSLLRFTRLVLGAFLLAQAALGVAACEWGARDAARAVAMASGAANAPCHEASEAGAYSALCLTHCLGAQSLDKPSVALQAIVRVALLPQAIAAPAVLRRELPLPAAAPPPRILFQSFLI